MGSESRVPTPLHHNHADQQQGNLQRSRRSIKLLKQKDLFLNSNSNGNSNSNVNLHSLINVEQNRQQMVSPDDMLLQIEANVRLSDINNNNPTTAMYNNNNGNTDETNINKYYSLNANTIPPYVVARLAYKGDINHNENEINNDSSAADPFTATFLHPNNKNNVKWGEFLHSIKIPTSSVPVKTTVNYDDRSYENGGDYFSLNDSDISDVSHHGGSNNNGEANSAIDIDAAVQSYRPSLDSYNDVDNVNNFNNHEMMTQIFRSYDFHSKWKGGGRLKDLFENSGSIASDVENCGDDEDDESDISDTASDRVDSDGNRVVLDASAIDLEKGHKNRLKRHRLRMHRHKRERDIRDRAKYWLEENKKTWKPKLLESVMTNSYVPLFFRLISITLSTIALGLSSRIVKNTEDFHMSQQPSPLMAMIVQAVGILYLMYITYDEFTSQPLGLRNPTAKIRLVMLDLLFIIFSSANLSLSFESIFDSRWICTPNVGDSSGSVVYDPVACKKVKALTAFLFLTLVAWCINFTISVFRIVHAVTYTRDKN